VLTRRGLSKSLKTDKAIPAISRREVHCDICTAPQSLQITATRPSIKVLKTNKRHIGTCIAVIT